MREQVEMLESTSRPLSGSYQCFSNPTSIRVPSTMIWPFWCSSNALMQRIKVDFPDPEGPQTTILSPRLTVKSISRKHVKRPEPLVHVLNLDRNFVGNLEVYLFGHFSSLLLSMIGFKLALQPLRIL